MVGVRVGQPGRQTGGLSVHLEPNTDRALRQACSGSQPASHTYTAFTVDAESNLFTKTDPGEHYTAERAR